MTMEANRALGGAFFKAQDRMRGGPDPDLCGADYVARIGANPAMPLAGHQAFASAFYAGFPDVRHDIEDTIVEGDNVVVRFSLHGTNTGDFMGIPATGKQINIDGIAALKVVDGRVAELVALFDQAGMMQQLGLMGG